MTDENANNGGDDAVEKLLDKAASPEPAPSEAKERVWSKLSESIGDLPGDEGDGESGDGGDQGSTGEGGSDGGLSDGGTSEAVSTGAQSAQGAGATGILSGLNLAQTTVAFLLGAGVGAGGYAVLTDDEPSEPTKERSVVTRVDIGVDASAVSDTGPDTTDLGESPIPEVGEADTGATTAEADTGSEPPEIQTDVSPRKKDAGSQSGESTLPRERLILSRAQSALARGKPEKALEALEEHADSFSEGKLVEERKALEIRALVQAGRKKEARRRAKAFLEAYPNSIFTDLVKTALP